MPPHPSTNFEIQRYHQKKPKFNSVYSINNLPKIKNGAYVINLDEYESISMSMNSLDSFICECKKYSIF